MTTKPEPRPVLAAIAKVMSEVGSVEKRGKNDFHRYDYATAADIAHALQKRMAEADLLIIPYQQDIRFTANDSVMLADFTFEVVHTSGDKLEERPMFTGMASCKNSKGGFDDKALNKCLTAAIKYFTLNLFRIPTGEYADADGEEDKAMPPNATQAKAQRGTSKPADERGPARQGNSVADDMVKAINAAGDVARINAITGSDKWKQSFPALPGDQQKRIEDLVKQRLHHLSQQPHEKDEAA